MDAIIIDDDTAREIEKLVKQVDEKMKKAENIHLQAGDIHLSELALVVATDDKGLCYRWQRWGFTSFSGKQLIINAQSESALEKRMFRESVEHQRIVVPAIWFYEWNKNKEKNIF